MKGFVKLKKGKIMVINNDYNKIQINEVVDKDANGQIIKQSLMLNIRCDDVDEALKLYRQLKAKFFSNPVSENPGNKNNNSKTVICECGKPMRLISGRNGQFYGCTGFPECRKTKELKETEKVPVIEVDS